MPLSQGPIRQVEKLFGANCFSAFAAAMVVCSVVVLSIAQVASAQDHPDAPSATQRSQTKSRNTPVSFVTTLNRKSIVFPDIATTEGPLTTGGKFKLFVDNSASLSLAGSALSAGIGQAEDYPHGYGQGGEGYGKRFGANMARTASSNFFGRIYSGVNAAFRIRASFRKGIQLSGAASSTQSPAYSSPAEMMETTRPTGRAS